MSSASRVVFYLRIYYFVTFLKSKSPTVIPHRIFLTSQNIITINQNLHRDSLLIPGVKYKSRLRLHSEISHRCSVGIWWLQNPRHMIHFISLLSRLICIHYVWSTFDSSSICMYRMKQINPEKLVCCKKNKKTKTPLSVSYFTFPLIFLSPNCPLKCRLSPIIHSECTFKSAAVFPLQPSACFCTETDRWSWWSFASDRESRRQEEQREAALTVTEWQPQHHELNWFFRNLSGLSQKERGEKNMVKHIPCDFDKYMKKTSALLAFSSLVFLVSSFGSFLK